jgi:hypothetical protein
MDTPLGTLETSLRPCSISFRLLKTGCVFKCFDLFTKQSLFTVQQIADFLLSLPRGFTAESIVKLKTKNLISHFHIYDEFAKPVFHIHINSQALFSIDMNIVHPNVRITYNSSTDSFIFIVNEAAFYDDLGPGKIFPLLKQDIPRTHPYHVLGVHLIGDKDNCSFYQALFDRNIFGKRTVERHLHVVAELDLTKEIENLEGFVYITYNDELITDLKFNSHSVATLTCVVPWALQLLEHADYIQLDGSFYAASPYAYTVPQIIIKNDAYPLGFSICPTESADMFTRFYSSVKRSFGDPALRKMLSLNVLADEGVGIKKFCKDNSINQFFCFRHLINKFGPGTDIATLVAKMLFTETKQEYDEQHELNFCMAGLIFTKQLKHLQAFEDLFGEKFEQNKQTGEFSWVHINDNYEEQALWTRNNAHIST